MRIKWPHNSIRIRARALNPPRFAIHSVIALHYIAPSIWKIFDAVEIGTEIRIRRVNNVARIKVIAPGIAINPGRRGWRIGLRWRWWRVRLRGRWGLLRRM